MDGLILSVDPYGRSCCYEFRRADVSTSRNNLVNIQKIHTKGLGILATVNVCQAEKVYNERTTVVCVVGDNENYICKYCYNRVQKKVKVRADCNCLTYCSDECLHAAGDFLDVCGPIIAQLQLVQDATWKDTIQLLKLAINYIYALSAATSAAEVTMLQRVMDLESHADIHAPVLQDAAQWLQNRINAAFPVPVLAVLAYRGLDLYSGSNPVSKAPATNATKALYTLLRVIKYNAQPLPVHGIQKVQLLTLLPSVARVNHSCTPNCFLMYEVQSTVHSNALSNNENLMTRYSVVASLVALRDIPAGDEAVVSYLQSLCSSLDLRQSLLKQAFQFDCRCTRCSGDLTRTASRTSVSNVGDALEKLQARLTANSGTGAGTVTQLNELVGAAEQAANVPDALCGAVSTVHDSASYALQQALTRIKYLATTPNKSNLAQEQSTYMTLAVRASVLMSQCWVSVGCGSVLSRIELVISGSNYAVQFQKMSKAGDASAAKCVSDLRVHLQDAAATLWTVYGCSGDQDADGATTSTAGSVGLLRDTSSGGYLKMLHAKALANQAALL